MQYQPELNDTYSVDLLTDRLACDIFRLKKMDISWLGHSCFKIKGSRAVIITDPYSSDLGYSLGKQEANIVTVSHQDPGHSYAEGIKGNPRVIAGPGEYEISSVLIIGVRTYHDAEKGEKKGKNTAYVIQIDEMTVCHLGDLGHSLTSEQMEDMENIDILLLPVGGVSTIDAVKAAEVVRQLEPKAVIPMHYKTDALKKSLQPVDAFLKEMGIKAIEPQQKVSFNKSNLPANMQVFLLGY